MPTGEPTDEALISAANKGSAAAFAQLCQRYTRFIFRTARHFTHDPGEAEDAAQEVLIRFAGRFPGFHLSAGLGTFLYNVTKLEVLAARRKRRRRPATNEGIDDTPAPMPDSSPEHAGLRAALAELPDHHREPLVMRFWLEMSIKEIAAALGVPEGTVKSRIHNALSALARDPRTRQYFEP